MADVETRVAELAKSKLNFMQRVVVKQALQTLPTLLGEGEEPLNLASGLHDGKPGVVITTDQRVLFLRVLDAQSSVQDFAYEGVSSVQTQTKGGKGSLTVFVSGTKAVITDIWPAARAGEIGDYVRSRLGGQRAAEADAPAPAPAADVYEQLRKLGELRDAGVLREEEFEAKKALLLARL